MDAGSDRPRTDRSLPPARAAGPLPATHPLPTAPSAGPGAAAGAAGPGAAAGAAGPVAAARVTDPLPAAPEGGPRPAARVTIGPTNTLTDVAGLRVGHHGRSDNGWLTGTTVVLAPPGGAVAGVDVRGGGPGTRETDVLDPQNLVDRVHAIVLSGGSAFGLAAATGVTRRLADAGVGYPVGTRPDEVVPIVPAAVLFDLGRGGDFRSTPDERFGAAAYEAAAHTSAGDGPVEQGNVGAGTGALTGTGVADGVGALKGGVGSASAVLHIPHASGSCEGIVVAALVVVNAHGSTVDPNTGELYGLRLGLGNEFAAVRRPESEELEWARRTAAQPVADPFHTTLAVVATDATLTKAQCRKLAGVAHDGMARAIRPVHAMVDGDTVFALSTCGGPAPERPAFDQILATGADALSRAITHAMLAATGVGAHRAYSELFPAGP